MSSSDPLLMRVHLPLTPRQKAKAATARTCVTSYEFGREGQPHGLILSDHSGATRGGVLVVGIEASSQADAHGVRVSSFVVGIDGEDVSCENRQRVIARLAALQAAKRPFIVQMQDSLLSSAQHSSRALKNGMSTGLFNRRGSWAVAVRMMTPSRQRELTARMSNRVEPQERAANTSSLSEDSETPTVVTEMSMDVLEASPEAREERVRGVVVSV